MKEKISSELTILYKINSMILVITIAFFNIAPYIDALQDLSPSSRLRIFFFLALLYAIYTMIRYLKLKHIHVNEENLSVFYSKKIINIPISEIRSIRDSNIISGDQVMCISFHKKNELGSVIQFLPSNKFRKPNDNAIIINLKRQGQWTF